MVRFMPCGCAFEYCGCYEVVGGWGRGAMLSCHEDDDGGSDSDYGGGGGDYGGVGSHLYDWSNLGGSGQILGQSEGDREKSGE